MVRSLRLNCTLTFSIRLIHILMYKQPEIITVLLFTLVYIFLFRGCLLIKTYLEYLLQHLAQHSVQANDRLRIPLSSIWKSPLFLYFFKLPFLIAAAGHHHVSYGVRKEAVVVLERERTHGRPGINGNTRYLGFFYKKRKSFLTRSVWIQNMRDSVKPFRKCNFLIPSLLVDKIININTGFSKMSSLGAGIVYDRWIRHFESNSNNAFRIQVACS